MAIELGVTNNFHPWYGRNENFDLLEAKTDSEDELTEFVTRKEREFWKVWIRDNTGHIQVAMYRPQGAESDWTDGPQCGLRYLPNEDPASLKELVEIMSVALAGMVNTFGTSHKTLADWPQPTQAQLSTQLARDALHAVGQEALIENHLVRAGLKQESKLLAA